MSVTLPVYATTNLMLEEMQLRWFTKRKLQPRKGLDLKVCFEEREHRRVYRDRRTLIVLTKPSRITSDPDSPGGLGTDLYMEADNTCRYITSIQDVNMCHI